MKPVRFTVAQVAALCGGELPKESGFAWERVEHFLLEDGVLQPYSGGQILPGPGIDLVLLSAGRIDHWIYLGWRLKEFMKQVTDGRLGDLYRALFAAGWSEPSPSPTSTRYAELILRNMVMQAVSLETIERREGRIPSVK